MSRIAQIETRLAPLKDALLAHPLYARMDRIEALRRLMEHHVFAVWDFMSLLKALQRRLCSVDVPWLPAADHAACRMVNEIVLAEESDEDGQGGFASHFELYRRAMAQCGADHAVIDGVIERLRLGAGVSVALDSAKVPAAARRFVRQTFRIIDGGDLPSIASAFTFGREDLLPDVFQRIVDVLNTEAGGTLSLFKYYLERHIGLDGDEHGPMALRLVEGLCGEDAGRWAKAEQAAVDCLTARRELWDGIESAILSLKLD